MQRSTVEARRRLLALFILGVRAAGACTVIELTGAGFAANAVHLLHAYTLFSHNNGTMYVNSTAFEYKCSATGGWHDFFTFDGTNGAVATVDKMRPGEACAHYTFEEVDLMLHKMSYDWFSIDVNAAKKASPKRLLCSYSIFQKAKSSFVELPAVSCGEKGENFAGTT